MGTISFFSFGESFPDFLSQGANELEPNNPSQKKSDKHSLLGKLERLIYLYNGQ